APLVQIVDEGAKRGPLYEAVGGCAIGGGHRK
ncbi:MAG: hypothetical protein QOI45_2205, partial [Thermoleophilaceae bacterium]|nr:hypothetical protein [Thermoleophilaceae bacterium]